VFYWKLLNAGVKVKLLEYEFYPHAFLNFHLRIPGLFYEDTWEIIDTMSEYLIGQKKLKETKEIEMPKEVKKKLEKIVERTEEDDSSSEEEEKEESKVW